jgi:hypothetical protein
VVNGTPSRAMDVVGAALFIGVAGAVAVRNKSLG